MSGIAGTLMVVDAMGVLLRGPAGSGKSDTALSLIGRGQQLVADDAVILRQHDHVLFGRAPAAGHGWLYLRGPGLLNVRQCFGAASVAEEASIDLVVDLTDRAQTDQAAGSWETTRIMNTACPRLALAPQRPIADLIIAAVAVLAQTIAAKRPVACA